jgi:hypothetical protein
MGKLRGLVEKKHRAGTPFIAFLFFFIFMRMAWSGFIRMRTGLIGMKEKRMKVRRNR